MQVTLSVSAGPHQGRSFVFREHDTFIVGRASYAHFRLETHDKFFSRVHFLIEVNPPLCRLIDMGSTNGTFVNGARVEEEDLKDGDKIRGGKTTILVTIEKSSDTEALGFDGEGQVGGAMAETQDLPRAETPPTMFRVPEPGSPRPEKIGKFRVVRELGRGGMGVVYLATNDLDGRPAALKIIQPQMAVNSRDVARFLREAAILRTLDHAGIVRFLEAGEDHGMIFIAMEYIDGGNLAELTKHKGVFPIGQAVSLICQLLETLAYAHGKSFVHRDIKPGNLLLTGADVGHLKLADFGLARVYQESRMSGLTIQGEMGGTVAFCAPEQITNFRGAKPSADLYSAGATLYMMLTGRHVFNFPNALNRQVLMVLQEKPIPVESRRPEIPTALARIIHRSLAKNPAERFPDAQAMRRALLPFSE